MDDAEKKAVIDQMFKSGAQYGYSKTRRHPSISKYIYGLKNKTEIIDLEKSYELFVAARAFVRGLAKSRKQILFVGNKPEAKLIVEEAAVALGQPYTRERWLGGLLTNFGELKRRILRLDESAVKKEKGEFNVYTKKERAKIDKEINSLERFFGGMRQLKTLPNALIVVDPKKEDTAIREAQKTGVPVVAIAGTDCDISAITYPIVANDSARSSISFFIGQLADAYREGLKESTIETDGNNRGNKETS